MKKACFAIAVCGCLATAAQAAVVYQENFEGGNGGALNGTATDEGSGTTWIAGSAFRDDGTVQHVIASSANGQAAWLPFTPVANRVYTLEASVLNDNPDWIGVGFLPAVPNIAAATSANWADTSFAVRHSNSNGYAWLLIRNNPAAANDQQAFNGPGTTNAFGAINGDVVPSNAAVSVKVILNTYGAAWSAEYFLNGTSYGSASLAATAATGIGGVGFSRDRIASSTTPGGSVGAFSLTVVPEPTTLASLGALSGLLLRRRK